MAENANDRFERLAAEFFTATGLMAPGKDQAGEMSGADYNARVLAWRAWNAERQEKLEADAHRFRLIQAWGEDHADDEFTSRMVEVEHFNGEATWTVSGPASDFGYYGGDGATLADAVDHCERRVGKSLDELLEGGDDAEG